MIAARSAWVLAFLSLDALGCIADPVVVPAVAAERALADWAQGTVRDGDRRSSVRSVSQNSPSQAALKP